MAHATALGTVLWRRDREALLGVRERLAARHHDVRDSRKQVAAVSVGTRVRALTEDRRGRWSPHRLLAVDGHRRTLPRLREALNPLPQSSGSIPPAPNRQQERDYWRAAHSCTGVSKGA